MAVNLAIGLYTPPVGTTLFIGSMLSGASIGRTVRELLPFYADGLPRFCCSCPMCRPRSSSDPITPRSASDDDNDQPARHGWRSAPTASGASRCAWARCRARATSARRLGWADVLAVAYCHAMNLKPDEPEWEGARPLPALARPLHDRLVSADRGRHHPERLRLLRQRRRVRSQCRGHERPTLPSSQKPREGVMRFDEVELEPVPMAAAEPVVVKAERMRIGGGDAPRLKRLLALLTDLSLFAAFVLALSPLLPATITWTSVAALAGFVIVVSYYYFAGTWLLWGKTMRGIEYCDGVRPAIPVHVFEKNRPRTRGAEIDRRQPLASRGLIRSIAIAEGGVLPQPARGGDHGDDIRLAVAVHVGHHPLVRLHSVRDICPMLDVDTCRLRCAMPCMPQAVRGRITAMVSARPSPFVSAQNGPSAVVPKSRDDKR